MRRIRHRCGYGVHSPFAFNLITQVIYEGAEYYAYATLKNQYVLHFNRLKIARLLFRLANRIQADRIVYTDNGVCEAYKAYIEKAHRVFADVATPCTTLYVATTDCCMPDVSENDVFILLNLSENKQCFERLKVNDKTTVTFDLYDIAILFFNSRLNKQDYIVNF